MLTCITQIDDPLLVHLKDDPVRPELSLEFRVNDNSRIFVLKNEANEPLAVTCVKFLADIPSTVDELANAVVNTNTAVFYTIWSYRPGAGRRLIRSAAEWIQKNRTNITEFVTLSPQTDMARIFHLRNGAKEFRINENTVNYLYSIE